jgi:hypothetical protein
LDTRRVVHHDANARHPFLPPHCCSLLDVVSRRARLRPWRLRLRTDLAAAATRSEDKPQRTNGRSEPRV